ncbi:SRPBCC family protein [Sphingomonas sp. LY54]|uniref:SRPBCC family protein n=1 Tax=Sphingomonas sp. LY54 TaxID=3095343 RepID=UPI002D7A4018|nr:SRPBCC family protein [Sphingomonas sp. LY54]WRP29400.1 SRPBCC family protein [Sphingomonas sp. LY54]
MTDRIEKTVDLAAPVERVWRAVTDHQEFGQWFKVRLDQPFAAGTLSTGMMTYPGYEHVPWKARVVRMDAPHVFAFEWPQMDEADETIDEEAWILVEFRLEPTPGGTRLTIVESGFDALPEGKGALAMRRNEPGWEEQTGNIKAHVEG